MLKWISERKHKKLLRMAQREKELMQVLCVHNYTYMGQVVEESYNGFDVDFDDKYIARCEKCGKKVESYNYRRLKMECGIKW